MMQDKVLLSGALLIICSSCGSSRKTVVQQKQLPEIVFSSSSSLYRAAEPRYWDIVHTDIMLQPFQQKNGMFLKEAEGEVSLLLHPYCYATDSLVLDAQTMEIETITLKKPVVSSPDYHYQDDKLLIKFDRKFATRDTIELSIKYRAKPYEDEAGGSSAISEDRGLYYINNNYEIPGKPKQIWTQGETQANSHWFPTLDQPNEKFTVSIALTVPDSFVTLSNGALVSSKKTAGNRVDKWVMDKPIQTYAVMFAIGKFSVVNDISWKDKPVNYYVEPEYASYAKVMFKHTPEMIDYFSKITGVSYPWNKYSQVVVRDYVSGAMENTSASLFGEFMNENARELMDKDNENVVSHELFHQWFGDYATAESWSNLTLNESFATYGEQLWRKHKYGNASNDELAYDDLNNYLKQAENDDPELVRYYYNNREDMFDRISYQKGGAILRYLHGLAGDSAFYKAMNIYLTEHAYGSAEADDWRKAVEEATGMDWNWFFNQWYYKGGHPKLKIGYAYDDEKQILNVTVTQIQDTNFFYQLPLKAKLVYGDKQKIIDWKIEKKKQVFEYHYENGVRPFFIPDVKHWLAGTINEEKHAKEWLLQYNASTDDYISKKRSINGAFYEQGDAASQTIFHLALKDKMKEIRSYALSLLKRIPDMHQWHEHFKDEVSLLAINDDDNAVRAEALQIAGKWKLVNLKEDIIAALNDSSYKVAGAALEALSSIDSASGYQKAKLFATREPKAELQDEVWLQLAKTGNADDIAVFEEMAGTLYGRRKISLAGALYYYAIRLKNEQVYEKTIALITKMTESENIKSYRYATGSNVFNLQAYYAGLSKNKKETTAERKMAITKKYTDELLKNEHDNNIILKYGQLLK